VGKHSLYEPKDLALSLYQKGHDDSRAVNESHRKRTTMISRIFMFAILLLAVATTVGAEGDEVRINNQVMASEEIHMWRLILQVPPEYDIIPGEYWYDSFGGFWGEIGGPTLGQIHAGLPLGGPLPANASGTGSGTFINGREIHPDEVAYLFSLFGEVRKGRFWVNAQGVGGYEYGSAFFDIREAARKTRKGGSTIRRSLFGSTGGDGETFYYLHPDGGSVMIGG
jgi:hypothetical protein